MVAAAAEAFDREAVGAGPLARRIFPARRKTKALLGL